MKTETPKTQKIRQVNIIRRAISEKTGGQWKIELDQDKVYESD